MRRRVTIAVIIAIIAATIGFAVSGGEYLLLERKYFVHYVVKTSEVQSREMGWRSSWRWDDNKEHSKRAWYVESGFLAHEGHRNPSTYTCWNRDGSVQYQVDSSGSALSPPWKWGVGPQIGPTAPWIELGISAEEWWVRVTGTPLPAHVRSE